MFSLAETCDKIVCFDDLFSWCCFGNLSSGWLPALNGVVCSTDGSVVSGNFVSPWDKILGALVNSQ